MQIYLSETDFHPRVSSLPTPTSKQQRIAQLLQDDGEWNEQANGFLIAEQRSTSDYMQSSMVLTRVEAHLEFAPSGHVEFWPYPRPSSNHDDETTPKVPGCTTARECHSAPLVAMYDPRSVTVSPLVAPCAPWGRTGITSRDPMLDLGRPVGSSLGTQER